MINTIKKKVIITNIFIVSTVLLICSIISYQISVYIQITDGNAFDKLLVKNIGDSIDTMLINFSDVVIKVSTNKELQVLLKEQEKGKVDYSVERRLEEILSRELVFVEEVQTVQLYDIDKLRIAYETVYLSEDKVIGGVKPDVKRYADNGKVNIWTDKLNIYFDKRILSSDENKTLGYLTITMSKAQVDKYIELLSYNIERYIDVMDRYGNYIIKSNQQIDEELDYIINTYKSPQTGIEIISCTSVDTLLEGPHILKKMYILINVMALLLIIFISIRQVKKIFVPMDILQNILEEFQSKNTVPLTIPMPKEDDVRHITYQFLRMIEEIDSLNKRVYEKEIQNKQTQLKALQAQINPHFLYNVLDCINWLSDERETEKIRIITKSLSKLFKESNHFDKDFVPVKEELEIIDSYLSIFNITLEDKLIYSLQIDEEIQDILIPKFILHPFVENAVNHGIKNKVGRGSIHVTGKLVAEKMYFEIYDDGIGIQASSQRSVKNTGQGIKNIRERLEMIYGGEAYITIESQEGLGTLVELCIPVEGVINDEKFSNYR